MDNNNGVVIGVVALIVIFLAVVGLAIFKKHDDVQIQQVPGQPIIVNPNQPPVIVNPPPRNCPPGQPNCPPNPGRPDINIQINPGPDHRAMYQLGWSDASHRRPPQYRNDGNYMRGYSDFCRANPGHNPQFRLEISR